jgi:enoyl-CoA hydratase/carnithine racemase
MLLPHRYFRAEVATTMPADPLNELLIVETGADGIVTVAINRPDKRNCLTLAMWRRLGEIFTTLDARTEVRGLVLTGRGASFCAGADISEFATVRNDAQGAAVYEHAVDGALNAIRDCRKPTVARIVGPCAGGGCGVALACDFRIADASARLGIPAARLSNVYGVVETRLLLTAVGLRNAKRVLYGGELFPAARALELGLVDEVAADLDAAVEALLGAFKTSAPLSIAGSKLILNALAAGAVEEKSAAIAAVIKQAPESEDYREGRRAFAEKRAPVFTGR